MGSCERLQYFYHMSVENPHVLRLPDVDDVLDTDTTFCKTRARAELASQTLRILCDARTTSPTLERGFVFDRQATCHLVTSLQAAEAPVSAKK